MSECIFCKIIGGEIDSEKVDESENFIVINDANPVSEGHCLIIPKNHYKDFEELPSDFGSELIEVTKKQISRLKENGLAEGVKLVNNCGVAAGQVVMHFHLHIIPEKGGFSRERSV